MVNVVVLGDSSYKKPFLDKGMECSDVIKHNTDLVVFTGGVDVDPSLYDESKLNTTNRPDKRRDQQDTIGYTLCEWYDIPMVGICRGAQFLTVMNGGRLIQDVKGHCLNHLIKVKDSPYYATIFEVTSTHHQMMYPFEIEHNLMAWSRSCLSQGHYKTGSDAFKPDMEYEPEVVYYPQSKSLAVQYHPEYMDSDSLGYKYFQYLVNKLLSNDL